VSPRANPRDAPVAERLQVLLATRSPSGRLSATNTGTRYSGRRPLARRKAVYSSGDMGHVNRFSACLLLSSLSCRVMLRKLSGPMSLYSALCETYGDATRGNAALRGEEPRQHVRTSCVTGRRSLCDIPTHGTKSGKRLLLAISEIICQDRFPLRSSR